MCPGSGELWEWEGWASTDAQISGCLLAFKRSWTKQRTWISPKYMFPQDDYLLLNEYGKRAQQKATLGPFLSRLFSVKDHGKPLLSLPCPTFSPSQSWRTAFPNGSSTVRASRRTTCCCSSSPWTTARTRQSWEAFSDELEQLESLGCQVRKHLNQLFPQLINKF